MNGYRIDASKPAAPRSPMRAARLGLFAGLIVSGLCLAFNSLPATAGSGSMSASDSATSSRDGGSAAGMYLELFGRLPGSGGPGLWADRDFDGPGTYEVITSTGIQATVEVVDASEELYFDKTGLGLSYTAGWIYTDTVELPFAGYAASELGRSLIMALDEVDSVDLLVLADDGAADFAQVVLEESVVLPVDGSSSAGIDSSCGQDDSDALESKTLTSDARGDGFTCKDVCLGDKDGCQSDAAEEYAEDRAQAIEDAQEAKERETETHEERERELSWTHYWDQVGCSWSVPPSPYWLPYHFGSAYARCMADVDHRYVQAVAAEHSRYLAALAAINADLRAVLEDLRDMYELRLATCDDDTERCFEACVLWAD